jgi:Kdo2-lipid IVA lauroyltransferase/acyltransferase
VIVRALAGAAGRLPEPVAYWLGRRLGDLMALWPGRHRQTVLDNLAVAFPELSLPARQRLARRSWQHLGVMSLELARLLARPLDDTLRTMSVDGQEHLETAMKDHGRALLLTAHLGNWELLSASHRFTDYGLSVVVRPLDSALLDALAGEVRRKTGVELIDKRGALRPVMGALRRGRLVGILMDQNAARHESVFAPFFGRPASTSKSMAVLALRTRTPVVPVFVHREAAGRHRVVVEPALPWPVANDTDGAIVELTTRCNEAIERAIRRSPEQWLWSHRRWRTRPAGESGP